MLQEFLLFFLVETELVLQIQLTDFGLGIPKCELSYSYLFSWASLCDSLS